MNRFKRKALRVITDFLSNEEVESIKEMFAKIDTDNDGIVLDFQSSVHNWLSLKYRCSLKLSLHDLQRMANDEHLHKAFSYFDKDRNGFIEPDELRDNLMEDGVDDCIDVANDIFQEVDTDKDGRISYDEFVAMMKTGSDWRKASRHYSGGRINSLSIKLMKDGSINLGE